MLGVKKMDSISWIHRIPASHRLLIGARIVEIDDVAASFGIRGSQSVGFFSAMARWLWSGLLVRLRCAGLFVVRNQRCSRVVFACDDLQQVETDRDILIVGSNPMVPSQLFKHHTSPVVASINTIFW
ncbi:hypothetical protein QC760_001189 [Botrytis cinerea]